MRAKERVEEDALGDEAPGEVEIDEIVGCEGGS